MINKCFEFKDYNHKRSEPNYTTVADFYRYCDNQNNVLKSLANCLLWQPSTDYTVGQIVRAPGMPAGHIAKCTTAGTSSEEEPKWTEGVVTDGTVKWSVYDPESATDDKITTASSKKLDKIGGAITGPISYDGSPKTDIELVNKAYVLAAIKAAVSAVTKTLSDNMHSQYPVGSYIYSDKADNPANYLPYMSDTVWEQTAAGRVLIGAGTADSGTVYKAGDKGGEEAHKLTVDELAAHSHTFEDAPILFSNINPADTSCIKPNTEGTCAVDTRATTSSGGNSPHENRMPYLAVYIWNRVA
ncbi:phage baseplate protein [Allisonella histaminiformans]|uniref:phage baseplate protein n=1 Tax=Allisonella histaminiformans TaxID=209880 RepID=UPI0022E2E8FB|nr:hypothetical protein [Allisonella histaminiformans]